MIAVDVFLISFVVILEVLLRGLLQEWRQLAQFLRTRQIIFRVGVKLAVVLE